VDRLIPMPSERQKIKRREFAPYFDTKHKSKYYFPCFFWNA
jgi:hypothetical protein